MVHGSTRRAALWAAPALLFWQPGVRVAAHHVTAALHVLDVVGKAVERLQQRCAWRVEQRCVTTTRRLTISKTLQQT